jgi:hypothetical protein
MSVSEVSLRATARSFTASQDEICELVLADAGSDIHSSPEGSSVKSVVLRLPAKLRWTLIETLPLRGFSETSQHTLLRETNHHLAIKEGECVSERR